jgi:hypothetical protein
VALNIPVGKKRVIRTTRMAANALTLILEISFKGGREFGFGFILRHRFNLVFHPSLASA